MRSIVLSFLLLSARGAVAAAAVWCVCRALRRAHAPSRLLCWLWLAVGVRFVLPWGIPLRLPRPQSAPLAAAALPWYARLSPWHALAAVWLAGVLVLALRGIAGYWRLRRSVALACKAPDGCYGGACVAAPFTLGILRPRIYLPDSLRGAARQAVLLHEQTHIRRGDPLTKPLFYAAVCLHWFNPLAWLAFRGFERDMEAACDEAAVQGRPLPERNAYCETLLQFAVQGQRVPGSLTFGQGSVKGRIVHLLHYRRLGAGALAVCIAVVGLCFAACMVRPELSAQPETTTAAPESLATAETAQPAEAPAPAVQPSALPTLSDAANSPRFLCPVDYKYISRFRSDEDGHRGDDLCADEGTEIRAAADGVVLAAQEHYSYGIFVELDHGTDADGLRWATLYAHMQKCIVQPGQTVTAGQVIGYLGHTGNTTGNACHFEMQVNGVLTEPRYFTAYTGSDAAELTQEKADEILAEAVRRAASSAVHTEDALTLTPGTVLPAYTGVTAGYSSAHPGVDLAAEEGSEVLALTAGIVTAADYDPEKGYYVVLDHGYGLESEYACLRSFTVSAGQTVAQQQLIGYVGSTGQSAGPHLHAALRLFGKPVDPKVE